MKPEHTSSSPLFESVFYPVNEKVVTLKRLWFAGSSMIAVYSTGALGYYWIGGGDWRFIDCLYMVLITLTTVGYGEVIPVTGNLTATLFTIFLLVSGLGVSAYFLSSLTAYILEGDLREAIWRRKMEREILNLKDHYIVCGAGEVGQNVIEQLLNGGRDVVVLELDEERLMRIDRRLNRHLLSVKGDATEDEMLKACGVEHAAGLVSALQTDRDNLFVVVSARQLNRGLRIISRATNDRAATKITRAGADVVVCPTTIGGLRMASEMMRPTVVGFIDLIVRDSEDNQLTVEELEIPPNSPLDGVELSRSEIRKVGNVLVLSVVRELTEVEQAQSKAQGDGSAKPGRKDHTFNPPPHFMLKAGMTLVALGELKDLSKLKEYVNSDAPPRSSSSSPSLSPSPSLSTPVLPLPPAPVSDTEDSEPFTLSAHETLTGITRAEDDPECVNCQEEPFLISVSAHNLTPQLAQAPQYTPETALEPVASEPVASEPVASELERQQGITRAPREPHT